MEFGALQICLIRFSKRSFYVEKNEITSNYLIVQAQVSLFCGYSCSIAWVRLSLIFHVYIQYYSNLKHSEIVDSNILHPFLKLCFLTAR